jgi:hypothetical protein
MYIHTMCIHTYIHMYIHAMCIHMYICMHIACMYKCMHIACMYKCMHIACMYKCMHIACMYIHSMCIYMYIHEMCILCAYIHIIPRNEASLNFFYNLRTEHSNEAVPLYLIHSWLVSVSTIVLKSYECELSVKCLTNIEHSIQALQIFALLIFPTEKSLFFLSLGHSFIAVNIRFLLFLCFLSNNVVYSFSTRFDSSNLSRSVC